MTNIGDLHIQQEILPLFDYTHNNFSKEELLKLLGEPLSSLNEILARQEILKGVIANMPVLKDYSYSRTDLAGAYNFLCNYSFVETSETSYRLKLLFSEKDLHQTRSKYVQLILLFHRLLIKFFNRINTRVFPEIYRSELKSMADFLEGFNLIYYEEIIREGKMKIRHLSELRKIVFAKVKNGEHQLFWKRLFLFEAYLSISIGINKHALSFPVFNNDILSFTDLYHPSLKQPVKNSFTINNHVVLLTGPNMSGKSTFLKAVGLSVYLAHAGLGVFASKAEMPHLESISIAINLNDDITKGYSHFMSEVNNLKQVILQAKASKRCLAVFDELFRGTNPEDATIISATTIKGLSQFSNSFFFISTHLHTLQDIAVAHSNKIVTYYFDCDLNNNQPLFNYQLKSGWSQLKIGQILFEKEDLNRLLNTQDN